MSSKNDQQADRAPASFPIGVLPQDAEIQHMELVPLEGESGEPGEEVLEILGKNLFPKAKPQ